MPARPFPPSLWNFGWALGLPGLALVVGVATPLLAPRMERRLDEAAGPVLRDTAEAGREPWLRLTVRGRDLVALGEAPDEAGRHAALDRLKRLPGLRHVVGRIGIVEEASPFVWTATRTGPERIELSGHRPFEIGARTLSAQLSAELPAGTRIVDEAVAARGAPPDFGAASAFAVEQLKPLAPGARATIADTTVSLTGEAATVADYESLRQAVAHPPAGFTMGKVEIRPAATPDFRFAVTRERGGALVLAGNVVSEAARTEIRALAAESADGAAVEDRMQTARAPEGAVDPAALGRIALRISALMQDGSARFADKRLTVEGTALDGQAVDEIDALVREARASGIAAGPVDLAASPLSPYRLAIRREPDSVTLSGHLPDAATRERALAALRPRFFKERIVDRSRIAEGAPGGLASAIEAGIASLSLLATGEVRISDRSLTLTGDSLYRESAGRAGTDLTQRMPPGWQARAEVVPPASAGITDAGACRASFARAVGERPLVFPPGSVTLRAAFYPVLDAVAEVAGTCAGLRIEIVGHADPAGAETAPKAPLDAGVESTASVEAGKTRTDGAAKDKAAKAPSDKAGQDKTAKEKTPKDRTAKAEAPKPEAKPPEPEPDLPRQRALTVVEYLLQAGIPADRIAAAPPGQARAEGQGIGFALRN